MIDRRPVVLRRRDPRGPAGGHLQGRLRQRRGHLRHAAHGAHDADPAGRGDHAADPDRDGRGRASGPIAASSTARTCACSSSGGVARRRAGRAHLPLLRDAWTRLVARRDLGGLRAALLRLARRAAGPSPPSRAEGLLLVHGLGAHQHHRPRRRPAALDLPAAAAPRQVGAGRHDRGLLRGDQRW